MAHEKNLELVIAEQIAEARAAIPVAPFADLTEVQCAVIQAALVALPRLDGLGGVIEASYRAGEIGAIMRTIRACRAKTPDVDRCLDALSLLERALERVAQIRSSGVQTDCFWVFDGRRVFGLARELAETRARREKIWNKVDGES